MEQTKETTTQTTEKAAVWSVRLSENDKIRLNNLLTLMQGTDNREKLMSIVTKAEAEAAKEETGSQFVAQMQQYADAIVKAAIAQAAAAGTIANTVRAEYEQTLADKTTENADLLEVIKGLESQIETLKATIKAQQEQISDAADRVTKQKEQIDALTIELNTAKHNADAVAEIQKEYSQRAKNAEAAKLAAEKAAADALAAQQAAEKATADANSKVANIASKYNALNGKLEEVQKQLTKAENRAEKAEERADKLLEKALAAAQPQQHKKAAAKATKQHAEDSENFEEVLEEKGQQKLVED